MSLADWRDIIIIAAGSLAILVLLALFIFTVVIGVAVRTLLGAVQSLVREEVTPLVDSAKGTVKKVQGTASFVSETVVKPVVRVYAMAAGARRAAAVLAGIRKRTSRGRQPAPISGAQIEIDAPAPPEVEEPAPNTEDLT